MKYSVDINLPITQVTELFINPDHYGEWKKDFVSYEMINGKPGQTGTVTKMIFKSVSIFETITCSNLPSEISGSYEHKRGSRTMMIHKATNRFSSLGENKTRYETESEIVKVFGLIPRIIMKLMAGAADKYYKDQLDKFKTFAENKTK